MIINVIDERSPSDDIRIARQREFHPVDVQQIRTPSGHTLSIPRYVVQDRLIVVNRRMTIRRIVRQIIDTINSAGGGRRLWLLRLISHGASGMMQLGTGLGSRSAGPFRRLETFFNRVTDPRQGLELHGCAVGSARPTSDSSCGVPPTSPLRRNNLLQRLADLTGVPVRAGVCTQVPDFNMQIEGAVVNAQPRARSTRD